MEVANTVLPFCLLSTTFAHKDRGTEVGTDVECVWDKPRNQSTPMEVDDIDIRTDTRTPKKVTPNHTN